MNFIDGSLHPENQEPLVITVAPYGPEWMPEDFPEDIPVTMEDQIQKAVDVYNAGATVLHLHVRELDGKGSKRLSKYNELIAGIRARVPDLIIQVGGSISFAPESEGEAAKWLSDDTRHMLAELSPRPDQVTVAVNTNQMNVVEQMNEADLRGTSMSTPALYKAYQEMTIPAGPEWLEEHIRRLSANGIQAHLQLANITQLETIERMMRRGVCNIPLILTWDAIGGGFDAPNIFNLANFVRACPDGAVLTLETSMLNVLPINTIAIALGLHVRCGNEDNLWRPDRSGKITSVQQVEQLVRISRELGRPVANCQEARRIYRIGEFYSSAEETLAKNGFAPNRKPPEVRAHALPLLLHVRHDRLGAQSEEGRVQARAGPRLVKQATVVCVPGLRDRMPDHWQELLCEKLPGSRIVAPLQENKLNLAARVDALDRTLASVDGPVVLVAHSAGTIITIHWAARHRRVDVQGALLAAPVDIETPLPIGAPTIDELRAQGWLPVPKEPLWFPSIVAASANDPVGPLERVKELARAWGSKLVELGEVGHLVPACGYGDWPDALKFIAALSEQRSN